MATQATQIETQLAKPSLAVAIIPFVLVGIVLLMVVPLPPAMLDLLLALSIGISIAILMMSINIEKPLDLSSFPTILLFATLLRLSLNIATTRLILGHGAEGTSAAGQVVRGFGEFMIGGNYVVGGTLFILLVVINFVVITKGSGRVAEVAARFTLDSMPGKQMAIDADLAAGAITQEEAKVRRKIVEQEADFFGAMDGSSKFVRGDAIAALVITGINIVVGFIVGMLQHGMSAGDAAATYTVLSVGDGLASQIPSLLVSTAAGVVVTRASAGASLAPTLVAQFGRRQNALFATAGLLGIIGILPGMPFIPFAMLAGAIALAARELPSAAVAKRAEDIAAGVGAPVRREPTEREKLEDALPVDLLELEVGFDLVPLVDAAKGGELVERIAAIRRNMASELGVIIPAVHIRDNLRLKPGQYRLLVSGNELGMGELRVGKLLAMDPTGSADPIPGEPVKEPAFGLPARWISVGERELAETFGYTVVDAATVAATHLTELFRNAGPDILGRTEAQDLIDVFARREPKLVDELIPNVLPLGEVIKVMRNLLREGVAVRDLRTIFETLADHGRDVKDTGLLTELVRQRMARHISSRFRSDDGKVMALVLDPRAEEVFRQGGPDAQTSQKLLNSLDGAARAFAGVSTPPVLVCAPDVRRAAYDFFSRRVPGLSVISFREIDAKATVRTLGIVTA